MRLSTQAAANNASGTPGFQIVDAGTYTGRFSRIEAIGGDIVISAISGGSYVATDAKDISGGQSISNGHFLSGYFTSVTIDSGDAVLYFYEE